MQVSHHLTNVQKVEETSQTSSSKRKAENQEVIETLGQQNLPSDKIGNYAFELLKKLKINWLPSSQRDEILAEIEKIASAVTDLTMVIHKSRDSDLVEGVHFFTNLQRLAIDFEQIERYQITDDKMEEIPIPIFKLPNLTSLKINFSCSDFDCNKLIQWNCPSLTKLELSEDEGESYLDDLPDSLEGRVSLPPLKSVSIDKFHVGEVPMRFLAQLTTLEELRLSCTRLDEELTTLTSLPNLKLVEFDWLSDEEVKDLKPVFKTLATKCKLRLTDLRTDDKSALEHELRESGVEVEITNLYKP